MKIPILTPKLKLKTLYIRNEYESTQSIIPIGCDCHIGTLLNTLYLRKESLPFDWLNMKPLRALEYVADNLENDFEYFMKDLYRNERKHPVSAKYPFVEFMHEPHIVESEEVQNKFKRRIERFRSKIKSESCCFLHIINQQGIVDDESVNYVISQVKRFKKFMKEKDSLHIYLATDELENPNLEFTNKLEQQLNAQSDVYAVKYVREIAKFGLWGDEKQYVKLLKDLRLPIKKTGKLKYQVR